MQSSKYDYQRPLDYDKLEQIRKNLLTNQDFMFPSNIMVILSQECCYTKDGQNQKHLYIPDKYGREIFIKLPEDNSFLYGEHCFR